MAAVELDRPAVVKGMVVAAAIAVPFALLGLAASDDDSLGWAGWLSVLGVLLGLVIGGFLAGARPARRRAAHQRHRRRRRRLRRRAGHRHRQAG